ncbi:unnamed protein product, partial [Rotaria sp. Silwood1]
VLDWSIVTYIDLRKRSDGFINTPPVAKFVSPQYAIVNKTIQINIPVSDANAGDDVRCRWSTYTTGYRRRKRFDKEEHIKHRSDIYFYSEVAIAACLHVHMAVAAAVMAVLLQHVLGRHVLTVEDALQQLRRPQYIRRRQQPLQQPQQ